MKKEIKISKASVQATLANTTRAVSAAQSDSWSVKAGRSPIFSIYFIVDGSSSGDDGNHSFSANEMSDISNKRSENEDLNSLNLKISKLQVNENKIKMRGPYGPLKQFIPYYWVPLCGQNRFSDELSTSKESAEDEKAASSIPLGGDVAP